MRNVRSRPGLSVYPLSYIQSVSSLTHPQHSQSSHIASMPGKTSHRTLQSSRRSFNQSALSTGSSYGNDQQSFRASSGFQSRPAPLFGGDSGDLTGGIGGGGGTDRRSLGAASGESYHQYRQQQRDQASMLHLESSLSSIPSMDDILDDEQSYELQLFAYRFIYVLQGAFMGLLGPSLQYFSQLAFTTSGLSSPVSSFGPIFAAHGGAALLMSFVSELVLNVTIEMSLMKYLTIGLLLASGAWYACLPPVAAATGNLGVSIYFIAKGVWSALLNISYVMYYPIS